MTAPILAAVPLVVLGAAFAISPWTSFADGSRGSCRGAPRR
jgi:hypothetical protein